MKRLFLFLLFALPVFSQVPATVTGLITDAGNNPATSGYVQFDVQPRASSIQYFILNVTTINPTTQCSINGSGQVQNFTLSGPCLVWGNDNISPGNTTYKVTFAPNGNITNIVNGELIVGPTYNLNAPVFATIVQINPQQTIVRANPFQTNILPVANSTFNIGSPSFQYASGYFNQIFLNGVALAVPGFTLATNNTWTGINTFTNTLNFSRLVSLSSNPALTGSLRLSSTDPLNWRNNSNTGDCTLFHQGPVSGNLPSDLLNYECPAGFSAAIMANPFIIDGVGSSVAATGNVRLHTLDTLNWRNGGNTADLTLGVVGASGNRPSDTLEYQTNSSSFGIGAGFFLINGVDSNLAVGGGFRLHSNDTANWRNAANSGDCSIGKNGSDQFTFGCGGPLVPSANLPATTSNCTGGQFATGLNAGGTPICSTPTGAGTIAVNSASTSFGTNIGATNITASAPVTGMYSIQVGVIVSANGAGCGAAASQAAVTITNPRLPQAAVTLTTGGIGTGVSALEADGPLAVYLNATDVLTYSVISSLGGGGTCAPAPKYQVFVKAIF